MKRFAIVKLTGVLLAGAALGAASVTAVAFHANSASPQFFAALAASLVAAATGKRKPVFANGRQQP